ncbi:MULTISPECIES: DUF1036 domain-containing protein [unclassified Bartonella]|uniref:DUF1036 domain-containing protein n=1 Tax=unclassified Bartonella TaxID=2645622 RepID=UPI0015F78FF7|nr:MULTISPECIES: DUF1036 domain-containing protein [unclassified Bartonella]UXN03692.1 DUF1036 domain-containing protein [Bartonella sp. HY406]UXN06664.1 DUF1036 domain-containing protein [Bartonella sp. HY761]
MQLRSIVKWFFAGFLFLISVNSAMADLRVCNTTQDIVGVAVGYRSDEGWVSEGWWRINKASCETVIVGSLSSRFYYLYAEDESGKSRWDGPVTMCGTEAEFKIPGTNDCFARGFQRFGFQEIDTQNQKNWMVQLTEPVTTNPAINNSLVTGSQNP